MIGEFARVRYRPVACERSEPIWPTLKTTLLGLNRDLPRFKSIVDGPARYDPRLSWSIPGRNSAIVLWRCVSAAFALAQFTSGEVELYGVSGNRGLAVSGRIKSSHLWAEWSQPGLMWIHNPQKPYDSQVDALFVAAVFRRRGAADAGSDPVGGMAVFASGRVVGLACSEMPEVCPAPSPDSPADRFRKR